MKKVVFLISLFLSGLIGYSQTLQDAQYQLDNENYFKAKVILLKLWSSPGTPKSDIAYYLGNTYLKSDDADSAKIFYNLVGNGDIKNPMNYLAAGRIKLLGKNAEGAKIDFTRATQLTKSKDANIFFEIGDAYFRPNVIDLNEAISNLEKANDLDGKNTTIMLELGDAYLENSATDNTMGGKAMNKFEGATTLNPKLALAWIKQGKLAINGHIWDEAIKDFNKALEIDPNYGPAHKALGEAYYYTKQYDKMIAEFKKYIDLSPGDTKARTSLLEMLFRNKDYDKVADEAAKGLKSDPKNVDYLRFLIYSDWELKRYKDGYEAMKQLMQVANIKLKPRDVIYGARLGNQQGDTTLAWNLYIQALSNDSSNCDLLGEYAKSLFVGKHYEAADSQYLAKKAKCGDLNSLDLYYLGRSYLLVDDSINADTTFGEFIKRNPTSPDGYYWRARTNLKLGKAEDFLAFPYYQKYIEVAGANADKYKSNLCEAYDYCGAYYFDKDKERSKANFLKVLELCPDDEFALEFMKQWK